MVPNINKDKKVELKGVLPKTADWVYFDEKGNLVVEHYDYSEDAQNSFGRDIAFLIHIKFDEQRKLYRVLGGSRTEADGFFVRVANWLLSDDIPQLQDEILEIMKTRFKDYYGIQEFLVQNKIEFTKSFDNWA